MRTEKGATPMESSIAKALSKQIVIEVESAYMYLQMADWMERNELTGFGNWMRRQAQQEVKHAMIIFNFLKERGVTVRLGKMRARSYRFMSVRDIVGKLLLRGKHIAAGISRLLEMAENAAEEDASILLAWFAAVQLEEEAMVADILERVNSCHGDAVQAMRELDQDLSQRENTIPELLRTQRRHGVA